MKYEVGDVAKVRGLEWFEANCIKNEVGSYVHPDGTNTFTNTMQRRCGEYITIVEVYESGYLIYGSNFGWEEWMFEDARIRS